MALFDIDANPTNAVNAWLAQFKVASDGAITHVSGDDTFHVKWINRSLQKIAWDFLISGDDEINLSKPNPSTSQALGTIITLIDFGSSFGGVRYRVNQNVMTYHFGGSVTQKNATGNDEAWYGLTLSGTKGAIVEPQVVQNGVRLASYWGTGVNQTSSQTISRIMIKAVEDGALIDGGRVTVKMHDYLFGYANFTATLGLTEAFSGVSGDDDPFNNTPLATVSGYGIDKDLGEGYNLLDLDGTGLKPYIGAWSSAPENNKPALYEYVKYVLSRDSGETLFGVDSNVWTGRVFQVDVDASGAGTFVQNETLSWPGGTGNLVAMDDLNGNTGVRLYLHLGTGVAPVTGELITGAGGATTTVGAAGSNGLSTSPNWLGQFTGSWIAAPGIGFDANEVTTTDSFADLDGNTVSPPNFVNINGTVTCVDAADDPHVYLTKRNGSSTAPNEFTSNTGNISGNGTYVVKEAISADTPQNGYIGIFGPNVTPKFYEYSAWSGSTFTLVNPLEESYGEDDELRLAYFYSSFTGAGIVKTISTSLIYQGAPIDVIGWIRQGDSTAPDSFVPINGQITAGGFQFSGILNREA